VSDRFSIIDAARERPDDVALIIGDQQLAWRQLSHQCAALAHRWIDAGLLEPNRPVALEATSTLDALCALFTAVTLQRPVVPLHPRTSAAFRQRMIDRSGAVDLTPHTTPTSTNTDVVWPSLRHRSATLALIATSGSTGEPKLAVLSRQAFEAAATASAQRLGWRDDDRWLLALTFAHVGGLSVLLRCLAAIRTIVVAPPEADPFERLLRGEATIASLVPTQLARRAVVPAPPRLRVVLLGGAAAPPALVDRWRTAGWPLRLTYGLTEACSQVATQHGPEDDPSSGPPLDGTQLRVDADGILSIRGPTLLEGYWSDGRVVDPRDGDGWLRTGDAARIDAAGRLHVLGRADDVIVTGGEKVAPAHVEALLLQCPGVAQACVFGVADEQWGMVVAAALVATTAPEETLRSVRAQLTTWPPHERVRRIALLPSLPLLPGGKVDRRATRIAAVDMFQSI